MTNLKFNIRPIQCLGRPLRKMFSFCGPLWAIPTAIHQLKKWLNGSFVCRKCGKHVYLMSFGYGETICPRCYEGEDEFIFPDMTLWLNRLLFSHDKSFIQLQQEVGHNEM